MYSKEHKEIIAQCVNSFGEGSHPMADAENAEYFAAAYIVECLCQALAWEKENGICIEKRS